MAYRIYVSIRDAGGMEIGYANLRYSNSSISAESIVETYNREEMSREELWFIHDLKRAFERHEYPNPVSAVFMKEVVSNEHSKQS